MNNLPTAPTVKLSIANSLKGCSFTKVYNKSNYKVIHAVAINQDKLLEGCISQVELDVNVTMFINDYLNRGV